MIQSYETANIYIGEIILTLRWQTSYENVGYFTATNHWFAGPGPLNRLRKGQVPSAAGIP